MSHEIRHETYEEKVDKKKVQSSWDSYVRHADYGEGASGLPSTIRWLDKRLNSYDEAMEYIEKVDSGWYDQIAVQYVEHESVKPTKKETELDKKVRESYKKFSDMSNAIHYKDCKSAFKGCPKCNSKLAVTYLKSNFCPLCGADLRPETTLNAIKRAKENYEKLKKEYNDEHKKNELKGKSSIRWLVKIEYHT